MQAGKSDIIGLQHHACPACRCNLRAYALIGWHDGVTDLPGMVETNLRLAAENATLRRQLQYLGVIADKVTDVRYRLPAPRGDGDV